MSTQAWLLGRQPIVDRSGRVAGYELLFPASRENRAVVVDAPRATAAVILGALCGFGVREVLGGHPGFINVDEQTLHSDSLELLPREAVVLELLETVPLGAQTLERCRALKAAGFSLALDDHRYDPAHAALYRTVDVVKVDLTLSAPDSLAEEVAGLRRGSAKLLAEKVETREQFERCLELGFDLFQGWYFAKPAVLERRRMDEDAGRLLELLRLLREDADIGAVERVVRGSSGLAYKLLVLVNSVAMGSRERIASVRQALAMLGRRQMQRWVQLALFVSAAPAGLDDPLVDLAATRANLMEDLARVHPTLRARDVPDQAFMAGMLSLLDALYAVRMPDLVSSLHLSDLVARALLAREGPLGELLGAAERLERLELEDAAWQLESLGVPPSQVLEAQRRALSWRAAAP